MIELKTIELKDKDLLIEIFKDQEVKKTYMIPDFKDETMYERMFEGFMKMSSGKSRYVRGVYLGETIVGFVNEVEKTEERIELGYVISPKHKGNGYCTEALEKSINYLLSIGYKEIICGAFEHHIASMRVMEKAGMKRMLKTDEIEYIGQVHKCIYYSCHI